MSITMTMGGDLRRGFAELCERVILGRERLIVSIGGDRVSLAPAADIETLEEIETRSVDNSGGRRRTKGSGGMIVINAEQMAALNAILEMIKQLSTKGDAEGVAKAVNAYDELMAAVSKK